MRRIATAAVLAGLMLLGVSTAFAVSAHDPAAAVRPILLDRSGDDAAPGSPTPSPSPSASPGDDGTIVCGEDRRGDAAAPEDCDAANDDNDVDDNDVNDRQRRGPDLHGQRGTQDGGHHDGDDRSGSSGGRG